MSQTAKALEWRKQLCLHSNMMREKDGIVRIALMLSYGNYGCTEIIF